MRKLAVVLLLALAAFAEEPQRAVSGELSVAVPKGWLRMGVDEPQAAVPYIAIQHVPPATTPVPASITISTFAGGDESLRDVAEMTISTSKELYNGIVIDEPLHKTRLAGLPAYEVTYRYTSVGKSEKKTPGRVVMVMAKKGRTYYSVLLLAPLEDSDMAVAAFDEVLKSFAFRK